MRSTNADSTDGLPELLQAQDTVTEPENPVALPQPLRGEIVFDDVQFRYPARPDRLSLSQINLTINPGETVALDKEESHHLFTVLRGERETILNLVDGQGHL